MKSRILASVTLNSVSRAETIQPANNKGGRSKYMKIRKLTWIQAIMLVVALAMPLGLTAQEQKDQHGKHRRYKLIDLGTFGGPASYLNVYTSTGFSQQDLNNRGMVAGSADTSTPDPYAPNCFNADCFVSHTFQWQNGVLTDLGALPGGSSSLAAWISGTGLIAGESQNGVIDPITGLPEFDAVLWKDGQMINLGTLGGTLSAAFAVNNGGQVVGGSLNMVPDPLCLVNCQEQVRAFLWRDGLMQDLGTLGGPDAEGLFVNERGQVSGWAFTGALAQDPFLWQNGTMLDLGTLGGTVGFPNGLNNRGQVVGASNLAGDSTFHPFLWTESKGMQDLGTFGGSNGQATWVNDAGEVVGEADFPGDQVHDAFLWKKGVLADLGNLGKTSFAFGINSKGQIVGHSLTNDGTFHGFLWENGGPMIDLSTRIPPGSGVRLTDAVTINDRGEIAALGLLPNGDQHAVLLIPDGDCDDDCEGRIAESQNNEAIVRQNSAKVTERAQSPLSSLERMRNQMRQRYHLPGQQTVPRE